MCRCNNIDSIPVDDDDDDDDDEDEDVLNVSVAEADCKSDILAAFNSLVDLFRSVAINCIPLLFPSLKYVSEPKLTMLDPSPLTAQV